MKKIFLFVCLCLSISLPLASQSAGPRNREIEAAVGEMLTGFRTAVLPLYDSSFVDLDSLDGGTALPEEELERVIEHFEAYLRDQGEAVHEYIVDSCEFARSQFDKKKLKITVVDPVSYPGRNLVYIRHKFDPDKEPELFISRDIMERFAETPEAGFSFYVNLFKQYYDSKHNSIIHLINGRNLLEEFLYWRDARMMQIQYLESLLDNPDIQLEPMEQFLSDSYYRDKLGGYFYLTHRLDSEFILNFARGFELVFAPKEQGGITALQYVSALANVGAGMDSARPDGTDRDMLAQYVTKVSTMAVFYTHFLVELGSRYPIYRESKEFQDAYLSAYEVWKKAMEISREYPGVREEAFTSFLAGFYEETPAP